MYQVTINITDENTAGSLRIEKVNRKKKRKDILKEHLNSFSCFFPPWRSSNDWRCTWEILIT